MAHLFYIPKPDTGIPMAYSGTWGGINNVHLAPHFTFPKMYNQFRSIREGLFMADLGIGEMFLNFLLYADLYRYCGVDVTCIRSTEMSLKEHA